MKSTIQTRPCAKMRNVVTVRSKRGSSTSTPVRVSPADGDDGLKVVQVKRSSLTESETDHKRAKRSKIKGRAMQAGVVSLHVVRFILFSWVRDAGDVAPRRQRHITCTGTQPNKREKTPPSDCSSLAVHNQPSAFSSTERTRRLTFFKKKPKKASPHRPPLYTFRNLALYWSHAALQSGGLVSGRAPPTDSTTAELINSTSSDQYNRGIDNLERTATGETQWSAERSGP